MISDLSWLANRVPQGVLRRTITMAEVKAARAAAPDRIPWTAIFAKAWALAAQDVPALRRSYALLPWPSLYETETSIASVMVEREWDGEQALVAAKVKLPETQGLREIAREIAHAVEGPIAGHRHFRSMVRANNWPLPIRRLLWWYAFNTGQQRHKFFGTFGVTVLGHRGVSINFPVSPMTTVLTLGPFQPDDTVEVTVGFDHRVMDGGTVSDAFDALERRLNGDLADELWALT